MTKQETADRRERLLQAAFEVLAEQGFAAATVKAIAHRAGVAPGLLHYYWSSKKELLVEVLEMASARYTAEMAATAGSVAPEELAKAGLRDAQRRAQEQPDWYRLRYELFALGLRDSELEAGTRELLRAGRSGIAQILAHLKVRRPDAVAAVIIAALDGLALQGIVDPELNLEEAYAVLSRLVS